MRSTLLPIALLALVGCGSLDIPAVETAADVCDTTVPSLSWSEVEDAAYEVTISRDGGAEEVFQVDAGTTTWSPSGPLAAGTWSWSVRAVTVKKEGEPSAAGTLVVKPTPGSPETSGETEICESDSLTLTATGDGTITWTSPADEAIEGATLDYSGNSAGEWLVTATVDGCVSAPTAVNVSLLDDELSVVQESTKDFSDNTNDSVLVEADQVALAFAEPDVGDGRDGRLSPTSDIELISGEYDYSAINIPEGVTVRVVGDAPLILRSTSDVVIAGWLDVSGDSGTDGITFSTHGLGGEGIAGGADGGDGVYEGSAALGNAGEGVGGGVAGNAWSGGGGAAHATPGFDAHGDEMVAAYGDPTLSEGLAGSGGGGGSGGNRCGSGGGGGGGGFVHITAPAISIAATGSLSVNGGDGGSDGSGSCGGGGGGSAGAVYLVASTVTVGEGGSISARGGVGGASSSSAVYNSIGADGADGRIRIDSANFTAADGTILPEVGLQAQPRVASGSTTAAVVGDRVCSWGTLSYDSEAPAGTRIVVDVLDDRGAVLAGDIAAGTDLSGIGALDGLQALDVRATLEGDTAQTPLLFSWGVDYTGR